MPKNSDDIINDDDEGREFKQEYTPSRHHPVGHWGGVFRKIPHPILKQVAPGFAAKL